VVKWRWLMKGEIGVFDVTMTEDARAHPLTAGMGESHKVMQWHMAEVKRVPQQAIACWRHHLELPFSRLPSANMR
jgi:GMP synthase-like glutamine amidotransferase